MQFLQRRMRRMQFREKVGMLPFLATGALLTVLGVTMALGLMNVWRLNAISREHYPRVQANWVLASTLAQLQRTMQDAVAASDSGMLHDADSLRTVFGRTLHHGDEQATSEDADHEAMAAAFDNYYALARSISARMASGEDVPPAQLAEMTAKLRALKEMLAVDTSNDEAEVASAFALSIRLQWATWIVAALVTVACVAIMRALLSMATTAVTEPLRDVVRAADRLAEGDIAAAASAVSQGGDSEDELGQLVRSMRRMVEYLQQMAGAADAIAAGELRARTQPRSTNDTFGRAFANMSDALGEWAAVADGIARGDLTVNVVPRSADDRFGNAFVAMIAKLSEMLGELRAGADAVSSAASQLTASAQSLSEGASDEAASVEETTASLDTVSASLAETAAASRRMEEMAVRGAASADESGRAMRQTVEALEAIATSVGVINKIASQTNLLALNAAIEAARAGAHGRGFAVLAAEIRKLSDESRRAAEAINQTALNSKGVAQQSSAMLQELVPSIRETATTVQTVASSASDQVHSLEQVARAMSEVDDITQRNAAAAQELAAMAEELSAQAGAMQQLAGIFRIRAEGTLQLPAATQPAVGKERIRLVAA